MNSEFLISANDQNLSDIERLQYFKGTNIDVVSKSVSALVKVQFTTQDAFSVILKHLEDVVLNAPDHRVATIKANYKGSPIFIEYYGEESRYRRSCGSAEAKDVNAYIYGQLDAVDALADIFNASLAHERVALLKWWSRGKTGEATTTSSYLPALTTKLYPELYPDMGDPADFIARYLASDAPILLMAGPPGTGKTTLLRHMICDNTLAAHVIYDEALMGDNVFQDFLFSNDADIMIVEDADTILRPREGDDNKLMARFLNVSDGLIKLPNKKMVFTTNVTDFGRIDQAILRPGRCFGVLHTRALNLVEAQAAAKVANLPIPLEKGEYTVAELFNQGYRAKSRRVGFAG